MTGDGKLLKISSLAALFVGFATMVTGAMLVIVNTVDMDAWMTIIEGLGSAVYGVRTAILANVPSNTSKIRGKALVLLLLALVVGGYLLYTRATVDTVQIVLTAIVLVIAIVALYLSTKIIKDQLRK